MIRFYFCFFFNLPFDSWCLFIMKIYLFFYWKSQYFCFFLIQSFFLKSILRFCYVSIIVSFIGLLYRYIKMARNELKKERKFHGGYDNGPKCLKKNFHKSLKKAKKSDIKNLLVLNYKLCFIFFIYLLVNSKKAFL